MTHEQVYADTRIDVRHLMPVRFEFTHPEADSVYIAGTFNNWQPDAKPMHPWETAAGFEKLLCLSALTNIVWSWMENFARTHLRPKQFRTRSGARLPF